MSLATRCSSCGTAFRVVQDQLKISEGWVRCGRCDAVFNALEGLFDLGRGASPQAQDRPAPPADEEHRAMAAATARTKPESERQSGRKRSRHRSREHPHEQSEARQSEQQQAEPQHRAAQDRPRSAHPEQRDRQRLESRDAEDDDEGPLTAPLELGDPLVDPIDAHLFRKRGAEVDRSSSVQLDERDRVEFSDARFDSDLFADSPSANDPTQTGSPTTAAADLPLESTAQQPDFLRRAERRVRWNSGPRRLVLLASLSAATLGLLLQTAHHFRDTMAARWPIARPALLAWCKSVGCSVEAPRRIDEVSVEHSDLSRAIGADALVLSVTLRSRSNLVLGLPSIELELTDGNGRLVARRALAPRDFGAAGLLQPGAETELQAMFNAGTARVAGYKVELFYP
ncbi:MAG: zinc-ribbon domain-containing protein [Pseudomonadota bacterium]|nr:zinc-ribbon domain-containing protein [Pseudomonadota bacterium]